MNEYTKTWKTTQAFEDGSDLNHLGWILMGLLLLGLAFWAGVFFLIGWGIGTLLKLL